LEVIVAREDRKSGGRVCGEEGSRRGVEVFEFSVEGGRTRFARKKLKKEWYTSEEKVQKGWEYLNGPGQCLLQ